MSEFAGKRVTVAGLGRFGGGTAVCRWLAQQEAKVLVTDQAPAEKLAESLQEIEDLPVEYRLGEHVEEDFTSADLVVASPAIAPSNPFLQAAKSAGVPVTTEMKLFVERCPSQQVFGITGTKGKSTTTAMLGEILKRRFTVWVGGNIGRSLLLEIPNIKADHRVVLELSSFMLEYLREIQWSPHVGVITMLAADHIEWHGSIEAYQQAKIAMIRFQSSQDYVVLNEENPATAALASQARGKVILFGSKNRRPFELLVPGQHNQLNAQAAFAAAGVYDVPWEEAQAALGAFKGLPHRLELVHEAGGVRYYNDSIATIPDAAIAALESFPPKKVIQIVGGYDKGLPLTAMCAALVERAKAVLCIGATGPRLTEIMAQSPYQSAAAVYQCNDLATAMKMARQIAVAGDVVLLSPGAASYDQFVNFQQRGELFTQLARGA